jgi:hypothetical protein
VTSPDPHAPAELAADPTTLRFEAERALACAALAGCIVAAAVIATLSPPTPLLASARASIEQHRLLKENHLRILDENAAALDQTLSALGAVKAARARPQ